MATGFSEKFDLYQRIVTKEITMGWACSLHRMVYDIVDGNTL
jgi:hypothetical protein